MQCEHGGCPRGVGSDTWRLSTVTFQKGSVRELTSQCLPRELTTASSNMAATAELGEAWRGGARVKLSSAPADRSSPPGCSQSPWRAHRCAFNRSANG